MIQTESAVPTAVTADTISVALPADISSVLSCARSTSGESLPSGPIIPLHASAADIAGHAAISANVGTMVPQMLRNRITWAIAPRPGRTRRRLVRTCD